MNWPLWTVCSVDNAAVKYWCRIISDLLTYVVENASENITYILPGSDTHRELWMVRLREVNILLFVLLSYFK